MKRSKHAERLHKLAREIAATGRHNGWFWVAGELSQAGYPLAIQLLAEEPIRSELDRLCEAARPAWLEQRRREERAARETR